MKNSQTLKALLIITFCSFPVLGSGLEPLTVSPGATDRVTGVEARCPTFSWQAVPGAVGYEVVVYQLPPRTELAAWSLDDAVEVLFVELPVGVTAWTPPLESGLTRGAEFVWFVRGVFGGEVATEWSVARFFRVAGGVPAGGGAVTRERSGFSDAGTDADAGRTSSRGTEAEQSRSAMAERVGEKRAKDVGTAIAAIRGEMPDVTGETYGVVGTSNSPEGAGLAAVNTAGGPDLVLDGVSSGQTDLDVYNWGLDRASPDPQTFFFGNTGGGGMTLNVDGADVVTTLTDQDTVGGLSCAEWQVAKWDGSQWICANDRNKLATLSCAPGEIAKWDGLDWVCALDDDSDALSGLSCAGGEIAKWNGSNWVCALDDDSDTLNDLSCAGGEIAKWNGSDWVCALDVDTNTLGGLSCAEAQVAKWDGSQWICANDRNKLATLSCAPGEIAKWNGFDWVCASDDDTDTTYTAGAGLQLVGTQFSLGTSITRPGFSITTLASTSLYTDPSVTIGVDGLALISYVDSVSDELYVAHCDNIECSSQSHHLVGPTDVAGGYYGLPTAIAVGGDGLGLIAYTSENGLAVAHCSDIMCSASTVAVLDTGTEPFSCSIAIGTDGLPLISFVDKGGGAFRVAHCDTVDCTTFTDSVLDSSVGVGAHTSITIADSGFGFIVLNEGASKGFVLTFQCQDLSCLSYYPDNTNFGGDFFSSVSTSVDGSPIITARYLQYLSVERCEGDGVNNYTCNSSESNQVFSLENSTGFFDTSMTIGADGLPVMSFCDTTDAQAEKLMVAHCADNTCLSSSVVTVDSSGDFGRNNAITIGADGLPFIVYGEGDEGAMGGDIRVAHCSNPMCIPYYRHR